MFTQLLYSTNYHYHSLQYSTVQYSTVPSQSYTRVDIARQQQQQHHQQQQQQLSHMSDHTSNERIKDSSKCTGIIDMSLTYVRVE